jgi:hypothetical protein
MAINSIVTKSVIHGANQGTKENRQGIKIVNRRNKLRCGLFKVNMILRQVNISCKPSDFASSVKGQLNLHGG